MANKKITLSGEKLKRYMIENSLDKDNKSKISVRKFIEKAHDDINFPQHPNGWTYWKKQTKDYEPYKGEMVDDELIWKYAIDKGVFSSYEVPLRDFRNKFNKQTQKDYEVSILRGMADELGERWNKNTFSKGDFQDYLKMMYGERRYNKLYKKHQRKYRKED